ncbi:GspH/FimT family pseudopilin [Cognatilysobacter terrigena]|uniref:GspH/FimT family pseudopilin n=1 Tax=Cognatilysobacter terrigena TaxID=2488749 RepID=UPI0014152377|nr:GspH/FimT family pseudopilin [Lysobacter terrigena]
MRTKVNGFTLIELIMTLAVASLILGVALPSLAGVTRRTHVRTTTATLVTSLASARLSAVARNTAVSVCPSSDGETCRQDGVWDAGWIVFEDASRSGRPVAGVLSQARPSGARVQTRSSTARPLVRFLPNGAASGTNTTIEICSEGIHRAVIVNNAGRARVDASAAARLCS